MKHFKYQAPVSYEEAGRVLQDSTNGKTVAMAGGTDLLGVLKGELLPKKYPDTVVALRDIPDTEYISVGDNTVRIGAMTRLSDIERDDFIKDNLRAVSQATYSVASPLIRNRATIGGNLCQDVRCWFYRFPDQAGGILDCMRKGGQQCYAVHGDNRYHSVFGGMKTHTTPCSGECPSGTDIPGYMAELRRGNIEGAVDIFFHYNPMPMLTSRVCPHPCQSGCNQCEHGDSVNIHGVERSLGEYALAHTDRYYRAPAASTGKKVAVVGAGPGGLSAAYYLRKAGNEVVVYDRMEKAGGVLRYGIPHYRLPKYLIDEFETALRGMGIEFRMNVEIGKDITMEELDAGYDAMYFGTGAWKQPILGLDGENLTQFGLNFLVDVNIYLQKAIGEDILVCGGGSVAMDVALTAIRLGARHVKLVCLEQAWEMPATPDEVERALEEGLEIYNGWGLKRILTDDNGRVRALESMRCKAVRDATGRFNPQYDMDDIREFESDYIILATGQRVDISFLGDKFGAQLRSPRGLIDASLETYKTKNPRIYAGGDVVTGPNIAIRAIRAGRLAAASIIKDFGYEPDPYPVQKGFLHFDNDGVKIKEMNRLPERPIAERTLKDEDTGTFSAEALAKEVTRCMNCGCYSVNASDLSPVMVMTDAVLKTSMGRSIPAADFFCTRLKAYANLEAGELITEVEIPLMKGYVTGYEKLRLRPSIDFAMTSLAWGYRLEGGRIEDIRLVLGAVAPVPLRLTAVEAFLRGKVPTEELAKEAGRLAAVGAEGIGDNEYKINEIITYVKRLIESMCSDTGKGIAV